MQVELHITGRVEESSIKRVVERGTRPEKEHEQHEKTLGGAGSKSRLSRRNLKLSLRGSVENKARID